MKVRVGECSAISIHRLRGPSCCGLQARSLWWAVCCLLLACGSSVHPSNEIATPNPVASIPATQGWRVPNERRSPVQYPIHHGAYSRPEALLRPLWISKRATVLLFLATHRDPRRQLSSYRYDEGFPAYSAQGGELHAVESILASSPDGERVALCADHQALVLSGSGVEDLGEVGPCEQVVASFSGDSLGIAISVGRELKRFTFEADGVRRLDSRLLAEEQVERCPAWPRVAEPLLGFSPGAPCACTVRDFGRTLCRSSGTPAIRRVFSPSGELVDLDVPRIGFADALVPVNVCDGRCTFFIRDRVVVVPRGSRSRGGSLLRNAWVQVEASLDVRAAKESTIGSAVSAIAGSAASTQLGWLTSDGAFHAWRDVRDVRLIFGSYQGVADSGMVAAGDEWCLVLDGPRPQAVRVAPSNFRWIAVPGDSHVVSAFSSDGCYATSNRSRVDFDGDERSRSDPIFGGITQIACVE